MRYVGLKARAFCSQIRPYSFESFSYSSALQESSLLEKSIRNGCSAIYTMSNASVKDSNVVGLYELLSDLTSTDEIRLENFRLGHCVDLDEHTIEKELMNISNALSVNKQHNSAKFLDFVTLSLSSPTSRDKTLGEYGTTLLNAVMAVQKFPCFSGSVGFHFSSTLLRSSSSDEINALLEKCDEVLHEVEQKEPPMHAIATNYLTRKNAIRVADWSRRSSPQTRILACEVLRMDEKRPGLLGLPATSAASGSLSITPSVSSKKAVLRAMEDLKVSMDRCLHMERRFMDKLLPDFDNEEEFIRELCVAHVLVHVQNNLHSIEEWDYLKKNDFEPKLEASLDTIRKKNRACAEWASLYTGLAKHLFSSMSVLHRAKKYMICDDILSSLESSHVSTSFKARTVSEVERMGLVIPPKLAAVAKDLVDADFVALSGVEIRGKEWKEKLNDTVSASKADAQAEAKSVLEKIDIVCSSYM